MAVISKLGYVVWRKKTEWQSFQYFVIQVLHVFASLDTIFSKDKNNTKIIEFGWVILILWSFLETQYCHFQIYFHLRERRAGKFPPCGHPYIHSFFCLHG